VETNHRRHRETLNKLKKPHVSIWDIKQINQKFSVRFNGLFIRTESALKRTSLYSLSFAFAPHNELWGFIFINPDSELIKTNPASKLQITTIKFQLKLLVTTLLPFYYDDTI